MKSLLTAIVGALLLALASTPALAASSFNTTTDTAFLEADDDLSWIVRYTATAGDGLAGVESFIRFNFLGTPVSNTIWNFTYDILNTSVAPSADAELVSFGFDTTGTEDSITTPVGSRFSATLDGGNFNGLGIFDACFYAGANCNGGSSNGVEVGEGIVSGAFSLIYDDPLASQTLSSFVARWQSTGLTGEGSASGPGEIIPPGTPTPFGVVPEPSTWAMMIFGLGAVGYSMRRRKSVDRRLQAV